MQVPQKKVADYAGLAGWLLIAVAFFPSWQLAYGGDDKRELQCSENNAKLTQYISDDQKVHALWGQKYKDDHQRPIGQDKTVTLIVRNEQLFGRSDIRVGTVRLDRSTLRG